MEVQLVHVAERSSRTVWKLEGKQVLFLITKKKVRSIRGTDNDNAGMVGSLKTGGRFG